MRFAIAYYFMLLYVTVMVKPLIPTVSDFLSHEFSETIHIATIHALYGNDHLQKELANASDDSGGGKSQKSINSEVQVLVHVPSDFCAYNFNSLLSAIPVFFLRPGELQAGYIIKNAPPPKFSQENICLRIGSSF